MNATKSPHPARPAARLAAALGAILVLAAPTTAGAESPVQGNVDLQLGPYFPRIDEEFDNSDEQPFADTFGSDNTTMAQLDAVYYLWDQHGKLGVGASFGYAKFSGQAQIEGGEGSNGGGSDGGGSNGGGSGDGVSDEDGVDLTEQTNFNVFPLGVIATYRWDHPVQEWDIPVALRGELGFDYYLWRIADESGNTADTGDLSGSGGTPGVHASLRGELLLDWIDPKSAAQFDFSWGINNTYLFWEFTFSRVRDFDGEGFRLGDNFWRLGLAFEF